MSLPQSITLSKSTTDSFRTIKSRTGINNNALARIALALAIESDDNVLDMPRPDADGQVLSRELMFGENVSIYSVIIDQYIEGLSGDVEKATVIAALLESGAHRMKHIRSLAQICALSNEPS